MQSKIEEDVALSLLGINRKSLQEMQLQDWDFPESWAGKYSFADLSYMRRVLADSGYMPYDDFR